MSRCSGSLEWRPEDEIGRGVPNSNFMVLVYYRGEEGEVSRVDSPVGRGSVGKDRTGRGPSPRQEGI